MSTDLEKYLREKRSRLDVESPDDPFIWNRINRGMEKRSGRTIMLRFRNIAAIALIALLAGYVINDIIRESSPAAYNVPGLTGNNLAQKEREYKRLIRYKKQEIASFDNVDNMIIRELTEELARLDTIYETVMKDLKEYGYNEKIMNTIFDTYEKKIRTLELIILETNKEKRYENEENISL